MSGYLPSFNKGETPTMLDAHVAKKVKRHIEMMRDCIVYETDAVPHFEFTDTSAALYVRRIPEGYFEKEIELCEDGVNVTYVMLVRSPDP